MTATSQSVVVGRQIKFMKQQLTLPLLLEARGIFFEGKIEKNRLRSNVLKRMAFCNVFVNYAKKVDVAAAIDKNHATVIHYNKQHDWHSKYCSEYMDSYIVAEALAQQYIQPDDDFGGLNRLDMINIIRDLRQTIASKQAEINQLNKTIRDFQQYKKELDESMAKLKNYSAI